MEIKHYDFHLSPLKPFIFEVMKIEPFSRPILPFYDTHEPLHLAYLYSGTLNSYVSGDCYLVPPWLPHRARKSDTGCTLGMVTLQPDLLLPCFFEQQDELRRLIMCSPQQLRVVLEKPQIKNAASRCFDELDLYQNSRPRQFAAIICFFSRLLEEDLSGIRMQFSLAEYNALLPAVRYVRNMQSGSLRESAAASLCHLGNSTFSRLFHKVFNERFCNFELRHRINQAAKDILTPGVSIKQVAEKWDFYDSSHFGRTFRKFFTVSPGRFSASTENLPEKEQR